MSYGCLGAQHQLCLLLVCHAGWRVDVARVMLKEARGAARTGHAMLIGNAGILPITRRAAVLVCGARTEVASGSS